MWPTLLSTWLDRYSKVDLLVFPIPQGISYQVHVLPFTCSFLYQLTVSLAENFQTRSRPWRLTTWWSVDRGDARRTPECVNWIWAFKFLTCIDTLKPKRPVRFLTITCEFSLQWLPFSSVDEDVLLCLDVVDEVCYPECEFNDCFMKYVWLYLLSQLLKLSIPQALSPHSQHNEILTISPQVIPFLIPRCVVRVASQARFGQLQ